MSNEVAVIELPEELKQIASTAVGLAKDKANEHLAAFAPFMTDLTTLSGEMEGINYEQPSEVDSKKASEIRKRMVKVRTGAEKEKDARKKSLLTEGNLIQAAFNLIKNACEMKEESLAKVEKYQELLRQAALEKLTNERMEKLFAYECNTDRSLVSQMTDETFNQFLNGAKATYEQKKEDERKAEEARIEAERISNLRNERSKAIRSVWNFLTTDEAESDFGQMSDETWANLLKVIGERKDEHEAKEAERQAELEKARKEKEEAEAKARAEREEAERIAREKQAEIDRLEREKRAKEEAEAKAKAEEEKKRIAEEKARKAAERKAANAPDKTKIENYFAFLSGMEVPTLKSEEANALLDAFKNDFVSLMAKYSEQLTEL